MSRIGGSLFEGVAFPIVFEDRYISVSTDFITGELLVDVYRWDRERDRLVTEMLHGRPLSGGAPITINPARRTGAIRLSVADSSLIGYASGGDGPLSVLISPDAIRVVATGDKPLFEMSESAIYGAPVGIEVIGDSVRFVGPLPDGLPTRRLIEDTKLALADIAGWPPAISNTDFVNCDVYGPAALFPLGSLNFAASEFDILKDQFVWSLPFEPSSNLTSTPGVIRAVNLSFERCRLNGIVLVVAPSQFNRARSEVG